MYVLLIVTGIVAAVTGAVMIGFGVPINEFSLGNTLIIAGTTALSAGLILVGLAAAVRQLRRIAEALARQAPRPARPAEVPEAPARAAPARIPFPPKPPSREAATGEPRPTESRPGEPPVMEPRSARPAELRLGELRARAPRPVPFDDSAQRPRPIIPPLATNYGAEDSETVPLSAPDLSLSPEILSPQVMPSQAAPAFPEPAAPAVPGRPVPARPEPEARAVGSAAVEVLRGPRLDPPWRPTLPAERQGEPERPPRGLFDSLWPAAAGRRPPPGTEARTEARRSEPSELRHADPGAEAVPETAAEGADDPADRDDTVAGAAQPGATGAAPAEPPAEIAAVAEEAPAPEASDVSAVVEERRAVSILKSGVVDGMAYTLYSDGSIEAELPEGMIRFTSIEDLRRHLDNHS